MGSPFFFWCFLLRRYFFSVLCGVNFDVCGVDVIGWLVSMSL